MIDPFVGEIVQYRLTLDDATSANTHRVNSADHYKEHAEASNGVQVHIGNQHSAGDVVPMIVVKIWPEEYPEGGPVCMDYVPNTNPHWDVPLSTAGINGQAFLDGNDTLWITSAPEGDFNGGWMHPSIL
jgi:hypothetical protein